MALHTPRPALTLLAAASLCGLLHSEAAGQYCTADQSDSVSRAINDSLARRFAPTLEFAPGERYFPTIPFFPAFDDVDRDPGPWQLSDSNRIAKLRSGKVAWADLDSAYVRRVDLASPRRARGDTLPIPKSTALFFRTRCLGDVWSSRVWSFLQNDLQRWQRSNIGRLYDGGLRDARFQVFEYYLYYLNDTGLEGHVHDIEKMFVFLPTRERPDTQPGKQGKPESRLDPSLLSKLVIVVGAGHSTSTPNNVLVLLNQDAARFKEPVLLVELGGHSVAPDYDRDGRFTPGLDINWYLNENVWGVRDLQAVAGTGYLGDYRTWMTLPRSPRTSVYLQRNPNDAFRQATPRQIQAESTAAVAKLDTLIFRQQGPPPSPEALDTLRRTMRRGSADSGYLLLPDSVLRVLQAATDLGLGDPDSVPIDPARRGLVVRTVSDVVGPTLDAWTFCGFDAGGDVCSGGTVPSDSTIDFLIRRMARWALPMAGPGGGKIAPSRWHVWENREYTDPAPSILKAHLYRPTRAGLRSLRDGLSLFGFGYDVCFGPGGQQFQVSLILPGRPFLLEIPGVVELQGGWYRRRFSDAPPDFSRISFGALYERHYKRLFSWYVKSGIVADRSTLEQDPDASDFTLGFGASLLPFFPIGDKLAGLGFIKGLAEDLRFRAGFRIDTRGFTPRISRFELSATQYLR